MLKQIYISTSFEGIHQWKDAPDEVGFLRNPHRHIFNVKVWFEVNHNDRDLEFFIMKWKVDEFIQTLSQNEYWLYQVWSCEMIADQIHDWFQFDNEKITKIEVNEDWENGIEFIY